MASKGQIYAEEFRGQLLERLPMAMEAMENATGKTSEEISKMMERGQLGIDVLGKFGKELSKLARQNGALAEALLTVRTQQNRFNTALQEGGDLIFQSGFGEGYSGFLSVLSDELEKGRHAVIGLGKIYKWFFDTLGAGVRLLAPVLDGFLFVFGEIASLVNSFGEMIGNKVIGNIALFGGALAAVLYTMAGFKNVPFVGKLFTEMGKGLLVFAKRAGLIGAVIAVLDELFSLFTKGRKGLLEEYIFGKDLDLNLNNLLTDLDPTTFGAKLGELIGEGLVFIFTDLVPAIGDMLSGIGSYLGDVDWVAVFQIVGISLGQVMANSVLTVASLVAGIIESIVRKIPSMGDFEITDSITNFSKNVNATLNDARSNAMGNITNKTDNIKNSNSVSTTNNNSVNIEVKADNLGSKEDRAKLTKEVSDITIRTFGEFYQSEMLKGTVTGVG